MKTETEALEEVILGAILLDPMDSVNSIEILKPEHFGNGNHAKVYEAISHLYKNNRAIDIITVTQEINRMGVLQSIGGAYFISSLTNRVASSANIEHHSRLLQQEYLKRKIAELVARLNYKLTEPKNDPFDLIAYTQTEMDNLINGVIQAPVHKIGDIKNKVIAECRETILSGKKSGIPSGITPLNNQTSGWQKGDLIILAGRPGMGKTACAMDFALTPALNGTPVAVFSLEMNKESLVGRILSMISSVNVQEIINKTINAGKLDYIEKQAEALNDVPLFIDETPAITLTELRNKARRLKRIEKIELIIVDYLQLIKGDSNNREQEISSISRGLKALAKELNVPIIALSQLSRQCEARPDKKPMLSDLRESGAIEQDADMVIFTYRPAYYGFPTYQLGEREISAETLLILIISKFRNGMTGEVRAKFIAENTLITDYIN